MVLGREHDFDEDRYPLHISDPLILYLSKSNA